MDQKNFIVAIVLSVLIIMGWQTLFPAKHTPPQQHAADRGQPTTPAPNAPPAASRPRPARRRPRPPAGSRW